MKPASSLLEQGYRFVFSQSRGWTWKHPSDIEPEDNDATDMDEDEFVVLVQTVGKDPSPKLGFRYE